MSDNNLISQLEKGRQSTHKLILGDVRVATVVVEKQYVSGNDSV